jgi:hypothetical protein
MIKTALLHGIQALVIQAIVFVITKDLALGAALAIGLFYGRENAQAQYKYANGRSIKDLKPKEWQLNPLKWNKDGLLDFIVPSIVVIVTTIIGLQFDFH